MNSLGRKASRGARRPRMMMLAMALVGLGVQAHPAWADDSERLRAVEDKLREVTEELQTLKARESDGVRSLKALEEAEQAKDKADAIEQRMNQQGIQARFGEGIILEDPRGNWSLRVGGRVQLDYRHFKPGNAIADTFSLRRARAGIDATLFKDYRIVVEAEYASGNATGTTAQNVALTLGYMDVGIFGPGARIRLGQFKPAFGYEQTILDLYSDYMERSFAQSLLQNLNYDRGFMVYGAPVSGLWYGVTLGDGVGQNLEEKQGNSQEVSASKPELTVRLTGNFAQFFDVPDKTFQAGVSYRNGEVSNSAANPYSAASVQTEARGITFFTPAAFNATGQTGSNITREFVAYEYLVAAGPVKVQGELMKVAYGGTRSSPSPDLDFKRRLEAKYVSLMWLVTGESYADFFRDSTIGKLRPKNRFGRGAENGWGALELGLRYSEFDGKDFTNANAVRTGQLGATAPTTTSTNAAKATTLQVKWIPNVYTRFWMNLVNTRFETPVVVNGVTTSRENALTVRAQIDF